MQLHKLLLVLVMASTTVFAEPFLYVTNSGENTVSVIDAAANTVVDIITGFINPLFMATISDGRFVYVANSDDTVAVIEVATSTLITTISSVQFNNIADAIVAVTPEGEFVYVANNGDDTVSRIEVATNTVVGSAITGFAGPVFMAITPDNQFIYVTNGDDDTIAVIEVATNTVITTISSGQFNALTTMAITPDGSTLYVANGDGDTISRVNIATNTVVGLAIPVGNFPVGLAITPDGSTLYVVNAFSGNVYRIDIATNMVIGSPISVGSFPEIMAILSDGSTGYVTNIGDDTVSVIDLTSNTVIDTITEGIGSQPFDILAIFGSFPIPGTITCNEFLNKTESVLVITWEPFSSDDVAYRIFNSDDEVIGTVSAQGALRFFVCFTAQSQIEGLSVAAVLADGSEGDRRPVIIG